MRWSLIVLSVLVLSLASTIAAAQSLDMFREILVPYYADPYQVNVSSLPSLSSLPIDNASDGINWTKIYLPKPCVSGDGGKTFIMVSRGSSDNLLVYMEGGGACTDYITCKLMPSVTTLNATHCGYCDYAYYGVFDRTNPLNPFRNWTIVYIPYSTGDVHSGNRVVKYIDPYDPSQNITVYHVGHVNAVVAMRWIAQQGNFNKIVIAGSSAGGYGTVANFYDARKIFNKSIVVINDAGPGMSSKVIPQFMFETTNATWGYYEVLPKDAMKMVKNGELLYTIEYVLKKFNDSIYCMYIKQYDEVIGSEFLGYTFEDFRKAILNITDEIKEAFPNNFCRYLPLGKEHTILVSPEFYTLTVRNIPVYQWVKDAINGNPVDAVAVLGDMNGDGKVTFDDLIGVLNTILSHGYNVNVDTNMDGKIDFNDLIGVLNILLAGG